VSRLPSRTLIILIFNQRRPALAFKNLGWDSPSLKICHLCLWLPLLELKTLLEEKSVTVELRESQLWSSTQFSYVRCNTFTTYSM
jgi:hypothetical protein